ncbi:uncharacterized protein LOC116413434 [Galleria mellonella]|uniref:Uncharacterized protein LOC116413434 n=1 Tax=Galleria mellonella TaxID=7137 RepID=A0ABM3N3E3_GALME|nr:uncharacterized protein LOC116413434 [Galleria mellonella]
MEIQNKFHSLRELEEYSYRFLQHIAKSMALPSNFKKVYLIQLIHAKQFGTMDEVKSIVKKVKLERLQLSQVRKKSSRRTSYTVQGSEISSTSNSHSPPITITPKRPGQIMPCSSDSHQTVMNYPRLKAPEPRVVQRTYPSPKKSRRSDRILRSFNIKTIKKTNYESLNVNNSLFNVIKTQKSPNETRFKVNRDVDQKWNIKANCVVKKPQQGMLKSSNFDFKSSENRCPYSVPSTSMNSTPAVPARRQRVLSGIYPITSKEVALKKSSFVQSIGFRHRDGKISKINALVQKPKIPIKNSVESSNTQNTCRDLEVTVQDIIDYNVETQTNMDPVYSATETNMPSNNYLYPTLTNINEDFENHAYYSTYVAQTHHDGQYYNDPCSSNYYPREASTKLPHINEVFSKFNDIQSDLREPIYVQVSEEADRIRNFPLYVASTTNNTSYLESLYNFRGQFVLHQPLLKVATTSNTISTYSTPVMASAYIQPPTLATNEPFAASSCEQDSIINVNMEEMPRISDLLKYTEQEYLEQSNCDQDNELNSADLSLAKYGSQEIGATVTIPEMVEDALEIISQDGDYLERIGMEMMLRCFLCSWYGPKYIMDYHLRKEHQPAIRCEKRSAWHECVRPGARRLVLHRAALYVLGAARRRAGCLAATLRSVASKQQVPKIGSLTVYNRITGEPYSWKGEIQPISADLSDDADGLQLDISRLGLSPITKINYSGSDMMPSITVEQPDMENIDILLYVRIFD